jgi:hypothetical protein
MCWLYSSYLWRCHDCKEQFTVRIGTVYEESRIELRHWCYAFWRACTSKKGVSALEIKRHCQISYRSALFLMNRIRLAPDTMGGRTCTNSDNSFTSCTPTPGQKGGMMCTTRGGSSTSSTDDSAALAARQKQNEAEIAGYAAAGSAATTLTIVLIQRHKAVKWAKTWCAEHPDENVWEHGRFHGKCKQANNPMTETSKSIAPPRWHQMPIVPN